MESIACHCLWLSAQCVNNLSLDFPHLQNKENVNP